MLLGRRGRSRAATVADGAWEDEMRLLARKLSQHRDRPRHRFLGSQGLNYGWSNIFVNLCCSRIGASFDVAVALCQTMLSRLAPKASVFLSVFKGACVNLCCCQPVMVFAKIYCQKTKYFDNKQNIMTKRKCMISIHLLEVASPPIRITRKSTG